MGPTREITCKTCKQMSSSKIKTYTNTFKTCVSHFRERFTLCRPAGEIVYSSSEILRMMGKMTRFEYLLILILIKTRSYHADRFNQLSS